MSYYFLRIMFIVTYFITFFVEAQIGCERAFNVEKPGSSLNRLKSSLYTSFISAKVRNNMIDAIKELTHEEISSLSEQDLDRLHIFGLFEEFSFEQLLSLTEEQMRKKSVLRSLYNLYGRSIREGPIHNSKGELEFTFKVELLPEYIQQHLRRFELIY